MAFSGDKNESEGIKRWSKVQNSFSEDLSKNSKDHILGKNTSKIYGTDPRLLLFKFARFKFVAKMFSGFDSVCEIGCGEAFAMPIVKQEVKNYHGLDFWQPFIDSCNNRFDIPNTSFEKIDILDGPLKEKYDGIFSMDVLEHIENKYTDKFIENITRSLKENGVCIIGMPSIESQEYASPGSKLGHVNCMSKEDLNNYCSKFFRNVFMFGMNDEVLHTGYSRMNQYIIALCSIPDL
tara:strand:- start:3249 stop:3956 length:708 start_codon:yes stop_codon:yes gene_type:complete